MPQDTGQEQLAQLMALIREAIQQDEQLRQTYQVGTKFHFVRDRLQALLETIEKNTALHEKTVPMIHAVTVQADEILVYVHLYNAQGMQVRTWQGMLTPKALFDYGVNRPIYQEKQHIEAFIASKTNRAQHAYLTVAMKKDRILPSPEEAIKDALGNPLIKVKEGSLQYERLVCFSHNEQVYELNEQGELVKRTAPNVS